MSTTPAAPVKILIETCLESGALTLEQIQDRLHGRARLPQCEAFVSLLESKIANLRASAEVPGTGHSTRDELCGAAYQFVMFRSELLDLLNAAVSENTSA